MNFLKWLWYFDWFLNGFSCANRNFVALTLDTMSSSESAVGDKGKSRNKKNRRNKSVQIIIGIEAAIPLGALSFLRAIFVKPHNGIESVQIQQNVEFSMDYPFFLNRIIALCK